MSPPNTISSYRLNDNPDSIFESRWASHNAPRMQHPLPKKPADPLVTHHASRSQPPRRPRRPQVNVPASWDIPPSMNPPRAEARTPAGISYPLRRDVPGEKCRQISSNNPLSPPGGASRKAEGAPPAGTFLEPILVDDDGDILMEDDISDPKVTGEIAQFLANNRKQKDPISQSDIQFPPSQHSQEGPTNQLASSTCVLVVDTCFILAHLHLVDKLVAEHGRWGNVIMMPWAVIMELDGLKSSRRINGGNAGRASDGVEVGQLSRAANAWAFKMLGCGNPGIVGQTKEEVVSDKMLKGDEAILDCCRYFKEKQGCKTALLSNDKNLCVKALVYGLRTVSFFGPELSAESILSSLIPEKDRPQGPPKNGFQRKVSAMALTGPSHGPPQRRGRARSISPNDGYYNRAPKRRRPTSGSPPPYRTRSISPTRTRGYYDQRRRYSSRSRTPPRARNGRSRERAWARNVSPPRPQPPARNQPPAQNQPPAPNPSENNASPPRQFSSSKYRDVLDLSKVSPVRKSPPTIVGSGNQEQPYLLDTPSPSPPNGRRERPLIIVDSSSDPDSDVDMDRQSDSESEATPRVKLNPRSPHTSTSDRAGPTASQRLPPSSLGAAGLDASVHRPNNVERALRQPAAKHRQPSVVASTANVAEQKKATISRAYQELLRRMTRDIVELLPKVVHRHTMKTLGDYETLQYLGMNPASKLRSLTEIESFIARHWFAVFSDSLPAEVETHFKQGKASRQLYLWINWTSNNLPMDEPLPNKIDEWAALWSTKVYTALATPEELHQWTTTVLPVWQRMAQAINDLLASL